MEKHFILGVHIAKRTKHVPMVQTLFTEFGCNIKTRLGLHDVNDNYCSSNGVILLEMFGDEAKAHELAQRLSTIEGVEVQKMIFEHS